MLERRVRAASPPMSASVAVVTVASLVGLAAFLYPLVLPALIAGSPKTSPARSAEAPLVLGLVAAACLAVLLIEVTGRPSGDGPNPRAIGLLAALVAIDALLRLIPTVGGASPVFGLILLVGVAFGPTSGFFMGTMTLLVSAIVTGGVGPWLPYQMLAAGWVGLSAGWLRATRRGPLDLAILALLAGAWGFLYGALLNLYSWPFLAPGVDAAGGIYWEPQIGLAETLRRYAAFYLTTSVAHDALRAAANVAFVLLLGPAILRLLDRFRVRSSWEAWDRP